MRDRLGCEGSGGAINKAVDRGQHEKAVRASAKRDVEDNEDDEDERRTTSETRDRRRARHETETASKRDKTGGKTAPFSIYYSSVLASLVSRSLRGSIVSIVANAST